MQQVLDSSALLAFMFNESGDEVVADALPTACISAVNLAEVAAILMRKGSTLSRARAILAETPIPALPADALLAVEAGLMWPVTRSAGASLGDRFCLALAARLDATMVTADRRLAAIAPAVGVRVTAIR